MGATWPIHSAALAFESDAYTPPSRASLAAFLRISPGWQGPTRKLSRLAKRAASHTCAANKLHCNIKVLEFLTDKLYCFL